MAEDRGPKNSTQVSPIKEEEEEGKRQFIRMCAEILQIRFNKENESFLFE